jgi:1,4-dihydroxy-2-naphthoate octaprenyltransferase
MTEKLTFFKIWFLAIRPKTLTAAIVPIIAGTALVKAAGFEIHWSISILALLASLFIQIATNLINDFVDFKKGADTLTRLGPTRVTQAGLVSGRQIKIAAASNILLAIAFGVPLVINGGIVILVIGLVSLLMAYAYTGGPFPLAYKGLGDIFVILFFGVIAVTGLFYLQTQTILTEAVVLGFQIGFHCAVLIAINNLRDIEGDKLVAKKTLPVRFGKRFARAQIALLCLSPFLMQLYWFEKDWKLVFWLGFLPVPLAINLVNSVFKTEPSPIYNKFLAKASGLHFLFGSLLALGMVL